MSLTQYQRKPRSRAIAEGLLVFLFGLVLAPLVCLAVIGLAAL